MSLKDWALALVACTALIASVAGALEYFAKDSDLVLVQLRLEQKILADERSQVQQRIWQLDDRNQARACNEYPNEVDKCECRLLRLRLEALKAELVPGYGAMTK